MPPCHRHHARLVCGLVLVAASAACAGAPQRPAPGPVEVTTVTVQPERVVLTTELPGRTAPYLVAEIRPRVNGLIQERAFEEGADVRKGSVLYRIDPAPYQAAHEQAKAALAVAEANLPAARALSERLAGLAAISAVGQQEADNAAAALGRAEAAVASARAALEAARIQLAYTPLEAPISGRIGRSAVTVGALVAAYQPVPLAVIQQLDPIYVDVTQSSAELLKLRRALASGAVTSAQGATRRARLVLEDGTPYAHEGRLQFRDVTVDPTTGSVTLRMVFPNPELVLLPGMYVRAVIEEAAHEAAILAPQQGVTRNPQGVATALVVGADGTAQERQLEVDRAIGDRWLVTSGLAAGDRVIVEGQQNIRAGVPVKEAPATPAAPEAAAAAPAKK